MDKQYYVLHWNDYWQSYAHLNPDLALNNITSKRALMNHFITCGYKENRKIIETVEKTLPLQYILTENIFKEKL